MTDTLNRPVAIGDKVLTKGYYSCNMGTVATIKKINKDTVTIEIPAELWDYATSTVIKTTKVMKRDSSSIVVITEQLQHNYTHYPELYI